MSDKIPTVYTDDPDAAVSFTVTDREGGSLDWADPKVAIGGGDYTVTATWLGDPGAERRIQVPMNGTPKGYPFLYLKVPGANDFKLGTVRVADRT